MITASEIREMLELSKDRTYVEKDCVKATITGEFIKGIVTQIKSNQFEPMKTWIIKNTFFEIQYIEKTPINEKLQIFLENNGYTIIDDSNKKIVKIYWEV